MNTFHQIGLQNIATALPEQFVDVTHLPVTSEVETLRSFGFDGAWIGNDAASLGLQAANHCLNQSGLKGSDIDVLLWASALPANHLHHQHAGDHALLDQFCYNASWLQEQLQLDHATVSGVAQQGCAGMFSALRQARALLLAEPELNHILCVGADVFPKDAAREVLYNVISDAGCACVMSRAQLLYKWLGFHQISKGYYWDVPNKQSEIIAAYYPTAAMAIRKLIGSQAMAPHEIDLVIPTGINRSSWPVLLRLCGIPTDRLYEPTTRFGHTVAADSFLMLEQAHQQGVLQPGMKLLLFAYGFGSSWSAILLETTDLIKS